MAFSLTHRMRSNVYPAVIVKALHPRTRTHSHVSPQRPVGQAGSGLADAHLALVRASTHHGQPPFFFLQPVVSTRAARHRDSVT